MSYPSIGMHYEDCRKKLKGPLGKDPSMRKSILNQARLHEGETAKSEIERELSLIKNRSHAFSGAGSKQAGIGDGERLGQGKWIYKDDRWQSK